MLLNDIADKKSEENFNFIMTLLRQQAIKKIFVEHVKKLRDQEMKTNGGVKIRLKEMKARIAAIALPIDLSGAD